MKLVNYFVRYSFKIDDVKTKLREKATVTSDSFSCKEDPNGIDLQLVAQFEADPDSLSVIVKPKREVLHVAGAKLLVTINEREILCRKIGFEGKALSMSTLNAVLEKAVPLNQVFSFGSQYHVVIRFVLYYVHSEDVQENKLKVQLERDNLHLLESADFSDITFVVQGEEIAAHKIVLASRSNYFKNMFNAGMKESVTNQVEISDVGPETFKTVLRFLYGGFPKEKQFEPLVELFIAADKYGMDELKEICETVIHANLQVENVIDALLLADTHNCANLLHGAKSLIKEHAASVKENRAKWNKLKERPDLLLELCEHFIE